MAAFHAPGFAMSFEPTPAMQVPETTHLAFNGGGGKEPRSLSFIVRRVDRRPGGEFEVTFEDGQVWQQIEANATIELTRGESVVIRRRAGSYVLESPTGLSTRVKRIR